jgi:hypothetical protein
MWEPRRLTTLRASKACRGENFTFKEFCTSKKRKRRRKKETIKERKRTKENGKKLKYGNTCNENKTRR